MSKQRPFPKAEGGCKCGLVRYRLLDSPLYCYACHCSDCQHESGSAFSAAAIIEWDRIASIGKQPPQIISVQSHKHTRTMATCPHCRNVLWTTGTHAPQTLNVSAGCFDIPGLMEPDVHIFIEDKIRWVAIPESAKTIKGDFIRTQAWPKSSLVRLKDCMERWEKKLAEVSAKKEALQKQPTAQTVQAAQANADAEAEADDRTPTNGSPEPKEEGKEEEEGEDEEEGDDDEFEKKADEIEMALRERLEKLTLKLEQEKTGTAESVPTTS